MDLTLLIVHAAIATGTAFLAAYLATRRFRTERWWTRKAQAYSDLVEGLHRMLWHASEYLRVSYPYEKDEAREEDRNWTEYLEARREVCRIANTAPFLVVTGVQEAVRVLEGSLGKDVDGGNFTAIAEHEEKAVEECLLKVKSLGAKDLGL